MVEPPPETEETAEESEPSETAKAENASTTNTLKENTMRAVIAIFLGALIMLGSLFIASPAQAAVCNSGTFCLYDNIDATGLMHAPRVSDTPRNRCIALPANVSNKTSYIRNRSDDDLLVYDNSSCSSPAGFINAQSMGQMSGVWVNSISSWCRCD